MLLFAELTTWITPLWLLSVGISLATVLLAAAFGIVWVVRRPAALDIAARIKESLIMPVVYLAGLLIIFVIVALPVVPYRSLLAAVGRITTVGEQTVEVTVPAATPRH